MIKFLQNGIESENPDIRNIISEISDINRFEAENGKLYRKIEDFQVPSIVEWSRTDFIYHYYKNYGHWDSPALLGMTRAREW